MHKKRTNQVGGVAGNMKVGHYLIERLVQLGATHAFGLPGDYNMQFLDHIVDDKRIEWVGCANELNASYAADGFARATSRIGVLITTFGVGELSAVNGIAGCYTERLPVLHIVGRPASAAQEAHKPMHHSLGLGTFDSFYEMSKQISCDYAVIGWTESDLANTPEIIDRVLVRMVRDRQPAYLGVPVDVFDMDIPSQRIERPLSMDIPTTDPEAVEYAIQVALRHFESAKCPLVLVDNCVARYHTRGEVNEFLEATGLPVASTPAGKSTVDEDHPQYLGIYYGRGTSPRLRQIVADQVDLLLIAGGARSDMNTDNFSYATPTSQTIDLHHNSLAVGHSKYENVGLHDVLPQLAKALAPRKAEWLALARELREKAAEPEPEMAADDSLLTESYLWHRLGSFVQEYDHVVADMGTSCFGATNAHLPRNTNYHQQLLYGSIGWSVGATLGVAVGARLRGQGRTLLFVGDGSLLLTMQEIATMMHQGLTPLIFVLNNDGYEIERLIHGPERAYNNIPQLEFKLLLDTLCRDEPPLPDVLKAESDLVRQQRELSHAQDRPRVRKVYHVVHTRKDLDRLFQDADFAKADAIHLVELCLSRGDVPELLRQLMDR